MEIHFKKPHFNRLCLMAEAWGGSQFGSPFILNRENIRAFIHHFEGFEGKYVFSKLTGQFGLSLGFDNNHRPISQRLFQTSDRNQVFGAYINFKRFSTKLEFELHGTSAFFGQTAEPDALLAANQLATLLQSIGLSASVEKTGYSLKIAALLQNSIPF